MKRDIDVIRTILLEAERRDAMWSINELVTADRPLDLVGYNGKLLVDAAYLDGASLLSSLDVAVMGLAWKGHDLLDAVRDATVFDKIKTMLRTKGLSLTLEAVKAAAPVALKALIGS